MLIDCDLRLHGLLRSTRTTLLRPNNNPPSPHSFAGPFSACALERFWPSCPTSSLLLFIHNYVDSRKQLLKLVLLKPASLGWAGLGFLNMAALAPQSAAPRRSRESNAVGSFTKMEEIGRGSFATVYKAVHVVSSHKSSPASLFARSIIVFSPTLSL